MKKSAGPGATGVSHGNGPGVFGESHQAQGVRAVSHSAGNVRVTGINDNRECHRSGAYGESNQHEGVTGVSHSGFWKGTRQERIGRRAVTESRKIAASSSRGGQ